MEEKITIEVYDRPDPCVEMEPKAAIVIECSPRLLKDVLAALLPLMGGRNIRIY